MSGVDAPAHDAPFATRVQFGRVEADGRFELQLLRDGEVIAFAMVDAALAERLSAEATHMARRCYAAARSATHADAAPRANGTGG